MNHFFIYFFFEKKVPVLVAKSKSETDIKKKIKMYAIQNKMVTLKYLCAVMSNEWPVTNQQREKKRAPGMHYN